MISTEAGTRTPVHFETPTRSSQNTIHRLLVHQHQNTTETANPPHNPDPNPQISYSPVPWNAQPQETYFQKRPRHIYSIPFSMDKGSVTAGMRALLYNWMTIVASDHKFTRDTYALSTSLMDMYFKEKPSVPKDQLQILGFAAVSLAAKMEENKSVLNLGSLFQKADILKFQLSLMKTLQFRLNPDTYVHWAKLLMSSWDIYQEDANPKYKTCVFMCKNQISFTLCRQFFQLADSINLHDKSGSWDKQEWVKNLFYILVRKQAKGISFPSTAKMFIKQFYKQDNFLKQFCDFISTIGVQPFSGNKQLGNFLYKFLWLQVDYESTDFQTQSWNQYISIQTFNKNMYNSVVKILKQ